MVDSISFLCENVNDPGALHSDELIHTIVHSLACLNCYVDLEQWKVICLKKLPQDFFVNTSKVCNFCEI